MSDHVRLGCITDIHIWSPFLFVTVHSGA